jgi:thioredoxin 1
MGVIKISSELDFNKYINEKDIVICNYGSLRCNPCKIMSPIFEQLSEKYPNITFIKIDIDQLSTVADEQQISSLPTFKVYYKSKEIDFVIGADKSKLKIMCEKISSGL